MKTTELENDRFCSQGNLFKEAMQRCLIKYLMSGGLRHIIIISITNIENIIDNERKMQ